MANIKCNGKIEAENLELKNTFKALKDIGNGFEISDPINVGIELGRKDGVAGTPYIDFHTDGNSETDYNSRLSAQSDFINCIALGGFKVNNEDVVTVVDKYKSGVTGYVMFKIGSNKLLLCWGEINQSFKDNTQYDFTLPNSLTYNNQDWNLTVSANGYTDCAWLNSGVTSVNGFYLKSQRYSNGSNTLAVKWKALGFVS